MTIAWARSSALLRVMKISSRATGANSPSRRPHAHRCVPGKLGNGFFPEFFARYFSNRIAQIIESRALAFHLMNDERVRRLPLKASLFRRIETSFAYAS
jgi:hypothetical protein